MPPKFDPTEEKIIIMRAIGGEMGAASALAPKVGPLGLSPKKVGEDIMKCSKDWKGLKVTVKLTDEEQKLVDTPFEYQWKSSDGDKIYKEMRTIEKLTMMRRNVKGSKEFEYEVKWKNKTADANEYLSASKLKKQGFEHGYVMQDTGSEHHPFLYNQSFRERPLISLLPWSRWHQN